MSITPAAMRRVMRELAELQTNPPEGVRVQTKEEDMLDVVGIIEGPEGTPYAGGYFKIKFKFTEEFPSAPPKCWFTTKIFHPNVSAQGEICVNTLKKDWKPTYGIGHILVTVKCLLIYPNPESALDEEAGKLLLEDYESYCSRARLITSVHATPKRRPVEFDYSPPAPADSPASSETTSSSSGSGSSTPLSNPTPTSAPSSKPPSSTTQPAPAFTLPIVARKVSGTTTTAANAHLPLTSSPSNLAPPAGDKELLSHNNIPNKDRHPSPSPLSSTEQNVSPGQKAAMNGGMGGLAPASKAVKRGAVTGGAATSEKRKKALKRL